jgi:metal-responsive CopG/Arc/MetJ family transcriptional regulator
MTDETTTITVSLPESLRRKIEQAAQAEDRTVSNFVRLLINRILSESEEK